jgi:hypothetical protein
MRLTTVKTGACAVLFLAASAGLSFAQTSTGGVGGTGSTGNESNNPAVIQNDTTGAVQGAPAGSMGTMDNSGAVPKPGKACGQRGENQGTSQPDAQVACE